MQKLSKFDDDYIFYSLSVDDIKTVAEQELDRELSDKEIEEVIEKVGDYISWYDTINYVILDVIKTE